MEAKELRIGNWINEQGLELQVGMITKDLFKSAEPIPLTEEWLVRFGFDKLNSWDNMLIYRLTRVDVEINNLGCFYDDTHIKYVHQLQNLYFALTGEELELK